MAVMIEEIKEHLNIECEIYALEPKADYMIVYDMNKVQNSTAHRVVDGLHSRGIWAAMVGVNGDKAFKIFKLREGEYASTI